MSASREKKKRQEFFAGGGVDPKAARAAEQKAVERKANILYATLAVVFVVVAVLLVVYNSGIIQRGRTAVTIDGENYTAADVSYYYSNAYQNVLNTYGSYASLIGLDTTASLKDQYAWGSTEQTWDEYFKEEAVNTLRLVHAALDAAAEEGMILDEEDQAELENNIQQMQETAAANGYSYSAYLNAIYGSVMTTEVYEGLVEDNLLANKYLTAHHDSISFTDEEIEAYYEENKNSYDIVDGGYVSFYGAATSTTDEEGNTVEPTEEESTAAMEEAKAQADAFAAALNEADDKAAAFGELLADYVGEDSVDTYSPLRTTVGSGLASSYSEWMQDAGRTAGDVTVAESTTSSSTGYYVVLFMDRYRDETPTVDIRHILIQAELTQEDDESTEDVDESQIPTQEALDAAKAEAEDLLAQWEAGDMTAESFGELANEYSDDTGSNTNGGLYEQVYEGQMFEAFNDWIFDEARQEGDTTVLENPQDGQQGWHVIYFQSWDDPVWKNTADSSLRGTDYNAWLTEIQDGLEATEGSGINYVG